MNAKSIITIVLLAFVGVSIVYLAVQESGPAAQRAVSVSADAPPGDPLPPVEVDAPSAVADGRAPRGEAPTADGAGMTHKVIVYYFHNTQRCTTCLKIEDLSRQAVAAQFADALRSGQVEWRVRNMEEPPNEHFATDYQLVASSLVIVDIHDGQQHVWSNMGRVWELVHGDEAEFIEYVAAQVRAYLES